MKNGVIYTAYDYLMLMHQVGDRYQVDYEHAEPEDQGDFAAEEEPPHGSTRGSGSLLKAASCTR